MSTRKQPWNENQEWLALPDSQKSYSVSLLNFFHYRRPRIAGSWTREETLTWELFLGIRLLPRELFLQQLLVLVAQALPVENPLVPELLRSIDVLTITNSPSLGLQGNKRNSCSDLGIGAPSGAVIWFEAKTAPITTRALMAQLKTQRSALVDLARSPHAEVIALLPAAQTKPEWPTITWRQIQDILSRCRSSLEALEPGTFGGLAGLAAELEGRIREHPLRISG